MTEQRSVRSYPADLEIRSDGRTLVGIACPFDSPCEVYDFRGAYSETIQRGAFARTIAERGPDKVKLRVEHNTDQLPIGRASVLREDAKGLYGEFRVAKTERGDEALELVRDGTLDAFSIGGWWLQDDWPSSHERIVREIKLGEVSVVGNPAYEDAVILGTRNGQHRPLLSAAQARLTLLQKAPVIPWT